MPSKPANQEFASSQKCKVLIDNNGEPVTLSAKKMLGTRGMKKQKKTIPLQKLLMQQALQQVCLYLKNNFLQAISVL